MYIFSITHLKFSVKFGVIGEFGVREEKLISKNFLWLCFLIAQEKDHG